jgi:hypothetical protein
MAVRDEGSDATPREKRALDTSLLAFANEHLVLLASITGVVIFAARCLIVSEGDWYVASILVAQTSVGDALRSLLFTVIPAFVVAIALAAAYAQGMQILARRWLELKTLGLLALSAAAILAFWYSVGGPQRDDIPRVRVGLLLLGFMFVLPLIFASNISDARSNSRVNKLAGVILNLFMVGLLMLTFVSIFAAKTFWLPRERLIFQGENPFTGYVLRANEEYLVILKDSPRVIVERPKELLDDRDFCHPVDLSPAVSQRVRSNLPFCP